MPAAGRPGRADSYLGNLYEIHRYLGNAPRAAAAAQQLAECLQEQGQADEAERYRHQAGWCCVASRSIASWWIWTASDGKPVEVLHGIPGRVQFVFERNRLTLRPASALTKEGERLAQQGRFETALHCFVKRPRRIVLIRIAIIRPP